MITCLVGSSYVNRRDYRGAVWESKGLQVYRRLDEEKRLVIGGLWDQLCGLSEEGTRLPRQASREK